MTISANNNKDLKQFQKLQKEFIDQGNTPKAAKVLANKLIYKKQSDERRSFKDLKGNDFSKLFDTQAGAGNKKSLTVDDKKKILASIIMNNQLSIKEVCEVINLDSKLQGHFQSEQVELITSDETTDLLQNLEKWRLAKAGDNNIGIHSVGIRLNDEDGFSDKDKAEGYYKAPPCHLANSNIKNGTQQLRIVNKTDSTGLELQELTGSHDRNGRKPPIGKV